MDSRIGLDYIVENGEYTTKLGAGKKQKKKNLQIKPIQNRLQLCWLSLVYT